jgi:hypothetical protein
MTLFTDSSGSARGPARLPTRVWALTIAAFAMLVCTSRSEAQAIAAASYIVSIGGSAGLPVACGQNEPFPYSCAFSFQSSNPAAQYVVQGLTSGGSVPAADIQASRSGSLGGAAGLARVIYSAVVRSTQQPPPATLVPVRVHIRGHASASAIGGISSADATAFASFASVSRGVTASSSPLQGPPSAEFDVTQTVEVTVDQVYEARVEGSYFLDPAGEGNTSAQAVADPEIIIDPSFAFADLFYVESSRNINAIFIDSFENGTLALWSSAWP